MVATREQEVAVGRTEDILLEGVCERNEVMYNRSLYIIS